MNRHDFLKKAKKYYSLYFKPQDKDVESVIREKCSKVDTDINAVIDFAKWIDNAAFKRPEINSDDILEFVIGPCVDSAEFWSDINKTVFYNGYVAGLAGIIKTIYISSDGKFYEHKHELIAENEEDFFDFLLLVEYDFHPIIKECVYNALREAGWYEGRSVDITGFCNELSQLNVFLSKAQLDFIKEFSGITVVDCEGYTCSFLSPEEILNEIHDEIFVHKSRYWTDHEKRKQDGYSVTVAYSDASDHPYCLQLNGILKTWGVPEGRTAMECINLLIKNLCGWLFDIDEPMNKPMSSAQDQ